MDVTCIAMDRLPGDAPVVMTERGESLFVYLSREHDVDTIAAALEEATRARLAMTAVR